MYRDRVWFLARAPHKSGNGTGSVCSLFAVLSHSLIIKEFGETAEAFFAEGTLSECFLLRPGCVLGRFFGFEYGL